VQDLDLESFFKTDPKLHWTLVYFYDQSSKSRQYQPTYMHLTNKLKDDNLGYSFIIYNLFAGIEFGRVNVEEMAEIVKKYEAKVG
jgi:hypothetical protein